MNIGQFRCFHCEEVLALANHGFCCRCYRACQPKPYCGQCGALLQEYALSCGECLRNETKWHYLVQVAHYKTPISHWIHQFKYRKHFWLDKALARLLLLAVKQAQRQHGLQLPEVLIPVPLFWRKEWQRGFNQAELLAKALSHWLNIPVDWDALQRIKATIAQQTLNATERQRNLKKAFKYQTAKQYQRVAIIDDVLTTGSTLNAICAELIKAGVKEIQVWVLAKT